jgi:hypothetical protein
LYNLLHGSAQEDTVDLVEIGKLAMNLGVIPALALFLVVAIQRQNQRLTDMVEQREKNNLEMLKLLIGELSEYKKQHAQMGGQHGN